MRLLEPRPVVDVPCVSRRERFSRRHADQPLGWPAPAPSDSTPMERPPGEGVLGPPTSPLCAR